MSPKAELVLSASALLSLLAGVVLLVPFQDVGEMTTRRFGVVLIGLLRCVAGLVGIAGFWVATGGA